MLVRFSLTLHLDVGTLPLRRGEVYSKTIDTMPPMPGDHMFLWSEGPMREVSRRYWDFDGQVCCEVQGLLIDPYRDEMVGSPRGTTSWYTDRDGSMETLLEGLASGLWSQR